MKKKPIVFMVLGFFHLLEPLLKIIYFKLTTGFEWSIVLSNVSNIQNPLDFFHFWLLFPLAGLALITVKPWSHPLFITLQSYSIYIHLTYEKYTWPYVAEAPFVSSLILLGINCALIAYLLMPKVRKPFFNKDIRWWEHHKRHNIVFPCTFSLDNPNHLHDAYVLNVSLSGAFVNYSGHVEDGQEIRLNLAYNNIHFNIKAIKVSSHAFGGSMGMGIHFCYNHFWDKYKMKRLIKAIESEQSRANKLVSAA